MSDLIDRQETINALVRYSNDSDMPYEWHRGIDAAEEIISVVPTAEPKKGKWIKNYEDKDLYTVWWYECSECECEPVNSMLTAFCPNCGARMEGNDE